MGEFDIVDRLMTKQGKMEILKHGGTNSSKQTQKQKS